ncbi:hypothetical protein Tco_0357439 [Tanacetum coccineum]
MSTRIRRIYHRGSVFVVVGELFLLGGVCAEVEGDKKGWSKQSEIWRLAASREDHKSEIENWAMGAEIYIKYYTLRSSLKEDENSMNERLVSSFRQFFLFQMSRPNGMFESSLESLNSFKNISTMMSNSPRMPPCCPKCYHDYEQELAKLKDAEKSAFEVQSNLPQRLRNAKTQSGESESETKAKMPYQSQYPANPKNERTSDGVLEAFQFLTASILLESTCKPSPLITCLRNYTSCNQNSHLENFAYSFSFLSSSKINPRYGLHTRFIKSMNTVGAFIRPKGITVNLKCPYRVLNAVFGMSTSCTLS